MKALLAAAIVSMPAAALAEGPALTNMCPRGKVYRGAPVDLEVKNAELAEVFRLLANVGRVSIVMASEVAGKVTLRLRRIPWDQVACNVAAAHGFEVAIDGTVVIVRRPAKP